MKRLRLSSGLELSGLNQSDCEVLYQQLFGAGSYLKHGLELAAGDRVFDVGANVGLFSIWLATQFSDLELYQFEPVPEAFAALLENRVLLGRCRSKAFQVALSDHAGAASLTYSPLLSSMATLHPEATQPVALADWARAVVADAAASPPLPLLPRWALRSRPLSYAAALSVHASIAAARALTTRTATVPRTTISRVMGAESVDRVDLLKIDVEGHELQVLQGIEESHWPRIRQLVVEVADLDGQLARVTHLLETKGYRVAADQEPWQLFKLHRLHNVYARR